MEKHKLCGDYEANTRLLDEMFDVERNFDLAGREMIIAGKRARLYFIDSFMSGDMFERLLIYLTKLRFAECDATRFSLTSLPYGEVSISRESSEIAYAVMSGNLCLICEAFAGEAMIVDLRHYPSRSIGEPSNDKVLRGARDGFIEAIKPNICMIRRRIRDTDFCAEKVTVGKLSQTDVALCYIKGIASERYVKLLRQKLNEIDVEALTLGHQSLAEALVPTRWYDPFPKFRYTERPDTAAASILEGSVVVLIDTSPEVMILPTGVFDFLQEANDYYLPPLTGSYLRLLRQAVFLITLILTPTWYLIVTHSGSLPEWLEVFCVRHEYSIPIIIQLFIVEFALDGLKLASLNTPDTLNNSLSVVGGLILGDLAVEVGLLVPEVIVCMAIVAIANFTQPSYELGYAFKFIRMMMLALTALFGLVGYIVALILTVVLIVMNNTVDGSRSYLYPLIPFNGGALLRLFLRVPARMAGKHVNRQAARQTRR